MNRPIEKSQFVCISVYVIGLKIKLSRHPTFYIVIRYDVYESIYSAERTTFCESD